MATPLLINSFTYGSITAAGDLSQQFLTKNPQANDLDWKSSAKCLLGGVALFGPVFHLWYKFLDARLPGKQTRTILKKAAADLLIITPIGTSMFYAYFNIIDKKSEPLLEELKEKVPKTLLAASMFWPPVQVMNFKFVPPRARVLYISTFAFLWSNILCFIRGPSESP